ncbi:MAG: S-layer homology domain-containing protein [Clostridia bacterium]|nr:S-layer homology domain-containing protein [Clostridia bacterium]
MKRLILTVLLAAVLTVPVSAYSSAMLSPALEHLTASCGMVKSSLVSTDITFTAADFAYGLGYTPASVTVTALPPSADGTLYYGSAPVSVNQIISASGLAQLRFVPAKTCESSSFRFRADGEYSIECALKFTDSVNLAPVASSDPDALAVWSQQDIAQYGTLDGSDPDGDAIVFEITARPERGILELTDPTSGNYRYTPCDGMTGSDSFTYTVRDEWGNYSSPVTVTVEIDESACDLVFADMEGHWAHNAALVMAAENVMDAESVDGQLYFRPDEQMTREEFLVTVMKALGAGEIAPTETVFADHDTISASATGYVNRAFDLGIVSGSWENGELCFLPEAKITRAEAAVILNAILGKSEPDAVAVFADHSDVPVWAKSSLYALSDAGIFKGTGSGKIAPNDILDRGQTAQILLTVKNMLD